MRVNYYLQLTVWNWSGKVAGMENETLLPFYRRHVPCMRENPSNVETLEDQIQEADWMRYPNEYQDEP